MTKVTKACSVHGNAMASLCWLIHSLRNILELSCSVHQYLQCLLQIDYLLHLLLGSSICDFVFAVLPSSRFTNLYIRLVLDHHIRVNLSTLLKHKSNLQK